MAAFERGDFAAGVALLDASMTYAWYNLSHASGFHAKVHARWARAEAFAEIGRTEEALRWYGSFGAHTVYDLPYQAPAHYEMGQLLEAAGDSSAAAGHYRRSIEMWSDADEEFKPLLLEPNVPAILGAVLQLVDPLRVALAAEQNPQARGAITIDGNALGDFRPREACIHFRRCGN